MSAGSDSDRLPDQGTESNGYSVRAVDQASGWEVHILRGDGSIASIRHCGDQTDARVFASTVQQHIYWLSPAKFEEYYRLQPAEPSADRVAGQS